MRKDNDLDKFSDNLMFIGIGIACYGIMSGMLLYLILSMKYHWVMYVLIIMLAISLSVVSYSIFKVIKINKKLNTLTHG